MASDRGCFEKNLSSSPSLFLPPLKLQEHIGFFPSLGACVGDLSLLFSPVDSPEVKVGVQSLEVKCFLEDKQECSELITLVMVTHF